MMACGDYKQDTNTRKEAELAALDKLDPDLLRWLQINCGNLSERSFPISPERRFPRNPSMEQSLRKSMASNQYSQGAQVEHQKFGLGTVMSSSEERIVIKFDDHGEKKFVTTMVMSSLKKSDRQPPAEKKGSRRKKAAPAAV